MHFSFHTLAASIIIAITMLSFILFLFQKTNVFVKAGIQTLFFLMFLAFLRLLLPFEFFFSKNYYLSPIISKVIGYFRHPFFFHARVSLWNITEIIWGIGIIVKFLQHIKNKHSLFLAVQNYGTDVTEQFLPIITELKQKNQFPDKLQVKVLEMPSIASPMLLYTHSICILLPQTDFLTYNDYTYIFAHEFIHFKKHDLLIKKIFHFICIIYWWNPVCRMLEEKLDSLLEMRVDNIITSHASFDKVNYINVILKVAKSQIQTPAYPCAIPFCDNKDSMFGLRMKYLLNHNVCTHFPYHFMIILASIMLFISSYVFTAENSYVPNDIINTYETNNPDNTEIIDNGDGSYDIYFYGQYLETTTSLDYYSSTIKIKKGNLTNEKKQN